MVVIIDKGFLSILTILAAAVFHSCELGGGFTLIFTTYRFFDTMRDINKDTTTSQITSVDPTVVDKTTSSYPPPLLPPSPQKQSNENFLNSPTHQENDKNIIINQDI